jgi:hypothetical protein
MREPDFDALVHDFVALDEHLVESDQETSTADDNIPTRLTTSRVGALGRSL